MPSLGPAEILVILVVALLVFGPNKMPEIARQVGKGMRELRRVQEHLSSELHDVAAEFHGDSASSPAPGGDPAPTLPPPADTPEGDATDPPTPLRPAGEAPVHDVERGARVWPPSPGTSS